MNAVELSSYAARLDATGLRFAYCQLDGSGNVVRLVDVDWQTVIGTLMALRMWRVVDDAEEPRGEATVVPIRRGDG